MGQIHKLLLISNVFRRDQITGIERNIFTVASLMKEILRNQNNFDISVITASRKQVTHLHRINVVQ